MDRIEYMKHLMLENDIMFLQEHWYMSSELKDLEYLLKTVHVTGISGMNEQILLQGRPHGGCALVYNKLLNCTVTPVTHDSKRCMACVVSVNNCKLLFINVYMPCDVHNNQSDTLYDEVLHDINFFINDHPTIDYIVVGGDFNTDITRIVSPHTILLHEFCDRESLTMCVNHPSSNIDYTYESFSGSRSTLDHFIVSHNLSDSVLSYKVLHDGDNLSDHRAIQLCLDINVQQHSNDMKQFSPHPLWRRATDDQINNYKLTLVMLLKCISLPQQLLLCKNKLCDKHKDEINRYYDDIVSACVIATQRCIPNSRSFKRIAGWSEHVKPYKDRSIFWHKIWSENGRRRQGVVFDIMQKTRADYKRVSKHD